MRGPEMDTIIGTQLPSFQRAIGTSNIFWWLERYKAFEQLTDNGFAEMPIDPVYLDLHAPRIYEGLRRIVTSPYRDSFQIPLKRIDELPEDMENGLLHRSDDEYKWVFHYFATIEEVLRWQNAPVGDFMECLDSASELDFASFRIWAAVGALFDKYAPGAMVSGGSMAMRFADGKRVSRLIDYLLHEHRAEAPDAKVHTDRGGGTTHWESTHPGLTLWNKQNEAIRRDETNRGSVLLFLARKFATITGGKYGPGVFHGVRDVDRSTRREDRRAIISFNHPTLTEQEVTWHNEQKARGYFSPQSGQYVL